MLAGKFYTIQQMSMQGNAIQTTLVIHSDHIIFEGHFPGQPIVPGVCMMQITREVAERALEKKLRIAKGDNIKFLAMLNPHDNAQVDLNIQLEQGETGMGVQATLFAGALVFFKFSGTFQEV